VKEPYNAQKMVAELKEYNILSHAISANQIRLVTHLDITPEMTEKTIDTIQKL
jgi:threonine aldolase